MEMGMHQCAGKMLSTNIPFYSWLCEARAFPIADFQMREVKSLPHDRPGL